MLRSVKTKLPPLLWLPQWKVPAPFTMKDCPHICFCFLVFSRTWSHFTQKKSTLCDQLFSIFFGKITHFCYNIHFKIISYKNPVSSTPFAKKNIWFGKKNARFGKKNARVLILYFLKLWWPMRHSALVVDLHLHLHF